MNKYTTLLISYIIFISYASEGLTSFNKPVIDYKLALKNKIIVNDINQAYYSSDKHCSVNYVKPYLKKNMNYTDHSNNTNITLNKGSIIYYKDYKPKTIKYSRNY